jgi:long-chain acyl-CoA synthetase
MGRVAARLSRQVEVGLAQVDLSLPQYRLLTMLAEGSVAASALADRLAVKPPSVTAVVDGLVSRGLVERCSYSGDRRRVGHVLTARGRRLLEEADRTVETRLAGIAAYLDDPQDVAGALRGLDCWRLALDAYRATLTAAVAGRSGEVR